MSIMLWRWRLWKRFVRGSECFLNTESTENTEKSVRRANGGVESDCAEGPDFEIYRIVAYGGH